MTTPGVESFALKLVLTPALIGVASLAGRRWGPAVGGWLVGLPFTSAPIAFFLALDQGAAFARAAAIGTLAGTISQAAFCLAYGALAAHGGWPVALAAGVLAFAAATVALGSLAAPLVAVAVMAALALVIALALMPRRTEIASSARLPAWDIPARMIVATAFVLALTAAAPALGAHLTGLLAPFPVYAAVLTVFAHRLQGSTSARGVLRGLLLGLFAFVGFFAVLAALLGRIGLAVAFGAATAVALGCQGVSLVLIRRRAVT